MPCRGAVVPWLPYPKKKKKKIFVWAGGAPARAALNKIKNIKKESKLVVILLFG